MNKKQRWVLFLCAAVIVLMLLFPPFHFHSPGGPDLNMGYAFLFDTPDGQPTVNASTLLLQWAATVLVCGILWFAFRDKS
jgi:4-hydroxybenzoate polyprenyltransferase